MKLEVINIEGKKTNNIEISDKIFSLEPSNNVIQTILDWQMNKHKSRTAKTKQRNEIAGSTAKIYAQKGTGGARHSSRKAPIFVGGGVAHGPKGADYRIKKVNKKVKKLGLLHLLSQKNKVNSIFVVEDFKKEEESGETVTKRHLRRIYTIQYENAMRFSRNVIFVIGILVNAMRWCVKLTGKYSNLDCSFEGVLIRG